MNTPAQTSAQGGVCPVDLLADERFHTAPHDQYRDMRARFGPVVPVEFAGFPAWLVIGYRELHQVTSDPELFPRDAGLWNQWPNVPADWPLRPMLGERVPCVYFTVGEEHRRHTRLVNAVLEQTDSFELRRETEELADRLIDAFCGRGAADLVDEFAVALPILTLARLAGFPDEDGPRIARIIQRLSDAGPDATKANDEFGESMRELLHSKRKEPGPDIASRILAFDNSPDTPFTEEEMVWDLRAIVAAGYLQTTDWIGNSIRLMLTDVRFATALGGARHSIAQAMNEVLWEDTPSQMLPNRWAARDTTLGGRVIRAGDLILLGYGGANLDPHVRQDLTAGRTVVAAGNSAHLSFSHGEFRCPFPAQEIAEIIARTGIEVLLDRLPDLELTVPAESLVRRPSPFMRGFTSLPVRFTAVRTVGDHS
ncbi:cytochrome P450 [Streptomyces fragilis]|uniref:Cytochrome P450 n=2 Tax=Streptomyces fragilis TaxID=67301 RepID=A0ABV2YPQ0_9ACTN|nr:cytochrome P450 [Streptomyces fragilis]